MRKLRIVLALIAMFSIQQVLADEMSSESKPCKTIAKACLSAGFTGHHEGEKKFWQDCMQQVLLGKTVTGVNVDAATITACRVLKIEKMKKELKELEQVK